MDSETFYGPGKTVDTNSKMTVVTQFLADGGSLSDIKRFYVQNGNDIANSESNVDGVGANSITIDFCKAQKDAFGDGNIFAQNGGMSGMSKGLGTGMVLVMSLWDNHYANMLWFGSTYPTDATKNDPGAARGTCPTDSGKPSELETSHASNSDVFQHQVWANWFNVQRSHVVVVNV